MSLFQFPVAGAAALIPNTDEEQAPNDDFTPISVTLPPVTEPSPVTASATTSDLRDAVLHMLAKADAMETQKVLTGHPKIIHDFAALLEDHMQAIPEDAWYSFQMDCLNLVQNYTYKQGGQQQQPPPWQHPPVWQQSPAWQPATWQQHAGHSILQQQSASQVSLCQPSSPLQQSSRASRQPALQFLRQQTPLAQEDLSPFKTPGIVPKLPTSLPSLNSTPTGSANNSVEDLHVHPADFSEDIMTQPAVRMPPT